MLESRIETSLKGFQDYLEHERRYSDHTSAAYIKDIRQFFSFLSLIEDEIRVDEVKFNQVRSWIVSLSEDNISNRSINRKICSLRSFYKFLRKRNLELVNPTDRISALKIPKRLPDVIKEEELRRIQEVVFDGEEDYFTWRNFTIVELLYNTGIRRSELIKLRLADFSSSGNYIKVMGKGKKERIIPLNSSILSTINSYIGFRERIKEVNTDAFFLSDRLNEIYPKAVYNIVRNYLSLVTTSKKKSPHVLRHSFATHLTNKGAELNAVKDLLGHASLAATQVYTHNSIEQLKNIYQKTHPKG